MNILVLLIPVSLGLGLVALAAFLWSLKDGQYDDPAGDAERILLDPEDRPLPRRDAVPTRGESST